MKKNHSCSLLIFSCKKKKGLLSSLFAGKKKEINPKELLLGAAVRELVNQIKSKANTKSINSFCLALNGAKIVSLATVTLVTLVIGILSLLNTYSNTSNKSHFSASITQTIRGKNMIKKMGKLFISVVISIVFVSCSGNQPSHYTRDFSNEKILINEILVSREHKAKEIIRMLDNSSNKKKAFLDMKRQYSENVNGRSTSLNRPYWTDTTHIIPQFGNTIFRLDENEYTRDPISIVKNGKWRGYWIVFMEKKISKGQYDILVERERNKDLYRIAQYEKNYMDEYNHIMKTAKPVFLETYIQPKNKKVPCKLWFGYSEGNKWFDKDSYQIYWDGKCKNGYANGLGREIEKNDMLDKWSIAIYENKKPTYYVTKDNLYDSLSEGYGDVGNLFYGVRTMIQVENNDINIEIRAGKFNQETEIDVFAVSSPFWNGSYTYMKTYPNFAYRYFNYHNNNENQREFEFSILDKNGIQNGWAFRKNKQGQLFAGEFINGQSTSQALPFEYNQKADSIIKEIADAQQKAYNAQEYSQKVKKQYLKKICKESIEVKFMDNDEYKAICYGKREQELFARINKKLEKLTEEKIVRLEQQRYKAQQQQKERHRQETLASERQRLAEQRRHNREQEAAAQQANYNQSRANFNQSMKNLNDQINSWRPKTYNVNVFHY